MSILFALTCLAVDALLVGIAAREAHPSTWARVRCGVWAALACVWCALWCAGTLTCDSGLAALGQLLCGCGAALALVRDRVRARLSHLGWLLRPLALLACVPVAFLMCEETYWGMPAGVEVLSLNFALLGAALLACWLFGQRRGGAALAFLAVCWVWGLANYFLTIFKGQTVLPSDVLAISTAAEVSAGYVYTLGTWPVASLCLLLATACALACVPPAPLSRKRAAANVLCGLAVCAGLVNWYQTHDIKQDYGVTVDVWATRDSYMRFGSIPCFLQRMQEVHPEAPEGYASADAAELQAGLAAAWDSTHPGYGERAARTASQQAPAVIAIMNESFSDFALYDGVEGYESTTARLAALGCFEVGTAYTSVRGGGTCNSEFEYLTGSTLGNMGGGVYPYMFYDMGLAESLPRYFSALGYDTTAIHPAARTNWRRDVVYQQLGFNAYHSGEEFADAEMTRGLCSDRATYDKVLEVLREGGDTPQFVFDVTLANHGGYDTGLLDDHTYDDLTVNGTQVEGMSEFLGSIDVSLDDLAYLLGELEQLDRPVLVVFFGDHQPGFNDEVAEASTGTPVAEMSLDDVQDRFATPYALWANYDLPGKELDAASAQGGELSLGYLTARTAYAAGLPLTEYQKALLRIEQDMPAVNLNGYQDERGWWYWLGQDGPAADAFSWYETLQYANLFDAAGNDAFARFEQGER